MKGFHTLLPETSIMMKFLVANTSLKTGICLIEA